MSDGAESAVRKTRWRPACDALVALARISTGAPRTTLLVALVLTALSLVVASGLKLKTGRLAMIPSNDPEVQAIFQYIEEFGDMNRLLAVIEGDRAHDAARMLAERLEADPRWVRTARAELDLDLYTAQYLHTLPTERVRAIRQDLQDGRLELQALRRDPQLATLLERRARRGRPEDVPDAEALRRSRALIDFLAGRASDPMAWAPRRDDPALSRPPFVDEDGRFVGLRRRKALVIVQPAVQVDSEVTLGPFMAFAREQAAAVARERHVTVHLTGEPALKADERIAADSSLAVSSLVSLGGVSVLFLVAFRRKVLPMLAVLCMLFSLTWTFAWARISVPYLTVVSMSFIAILIGLGIDFAIHLITHFEERVAHLPAPRAAILDACEAVVPGVLTGALTTSAAFFSMLMVGFPAFRGLGIVAGGGILLAVVQTFSVLPAVILLWTRRHPLASEPEPSPGDQFFRWLAGRIHMSPGLGLLVALGIFLVCLEPARDLPFQTNLLSMNDPESESMRELDSFLPDFGFAPTQDALIYDDLEAMERGVRALEAEPAISYVDSIIRVLPSRPDRNREEIARIRSLLDELGPRPPPPAPDRARRRRSLEHLADQVAKLRLLELATGRPDAALEAERLRRDLVGLLEVPDPDLDRRERQLFDALWNQLADLDSASRSAPATLGTLPPEVLARALGSRGRYTVVVAPGLDVRQAEEAQRFTELTDRVAAETGGEHTGIVSLSRHMVGLLERGYQETCAYALLGVVILLLLDLQNLSLVLLVLAVCALGIVALRATMALHGLTLNPANFIAIPLLLGIGVDNAVHLLHPWLRGESLEDILAHCGRPIVLNSATSMIGFGGLVAASHKGLYSLGWVMTAGVFWCMVASLLVVPGGLDLLRRSREWWDRRAEALVSHRFT